MISRDKRSSFNIVRGSFLAGTLLGFVLVILGQVLVPTTNYLSTAGASLILVIYGLTGYFGFRRIRPEILRLASLFGLLAGAAFASEIVLEYVILPKDNTGWGIIEFGSVFALYLLSGLVTTYRYKNIKYGILASVISAMLSSMVWLVIVLLMFYLFQGTTRQTLVFMAEGNFEDFTRSGMKDFNTFMMEDFLGAGFFHLLLSPLFATILGTIGSLLAKGMAQLKILQQQNKNG